MSSCAITLTLPLTLTLILTLTLTPTLTPTLPLSRCAEERRREEAEELTEGLRAASQSGLLAAVAEQEATGVGLQAVTSVLVEAEAEVAALRGAWQQARPNPNPDPNS